MSTSPHWVDKLPVERISRQAFDSLGEYSCSLPTGTRVGKVWKQNLTAYNVAHGLPKADPLWVLCEYVSHSDPSKVGIEYRRPEIIEPCVTSG